MIAVKRTTKPKVLQQKADTWTKSLLILKTKMDSLKKESVEWRKIKQEYQQAENKYRHDSIKDALKSTDMFNGKCAYCESFILHIDYGHIEHYYPKSTFPEYTFEWTNLLLACGVCNGQQFKGNKFPIFEEQPLLLNPCNDNPSEHFNFDYDLDTHLASVYGKTDRGEITEKTLGLNRPDLLRYRSQMVKRIIFLGLKTSEGDKEAKSLLDEACKSSQAYSAFAQVIRNKFT